MNLSKAAANIAVWVLFVAVAGCRETAEVRQKPPAGVFKNAAVSKQAIPASQQTTSQDYGKVILSDLNAILDISKEFVKRGDVGKAFSRADAILALNDHPDTEQNTLAKFLKNALSGFSTCMDIETAKGMIIALASMDRSALQGKNSVTEGLIQLVERNMYGQLRTGAEVKTSTLRSLLFMLQGADIPLNLTVFGLNTRIPLRYFIDSPDHPAGVPGTAMGITTNGADWAIGEIATAQQWGRKGRIKLDEKYVHMDQFQALDWVLYKKRYHVGIFGITLMKFDGLVGIMSNRFLQIVMPIVLPRSLTDPFPAFVELAGGMSDAEYNGGRYDGFTTTSWTDRYGTAGRRHKIFALLSPIIEYCWNAQLADGRSRTKKMVALAAGLNEIAPSDYQPLTYLGRRNPNATFRVEKTGHETVMRTFEDSGLLRALLQRDGDQGSDILAPLLDMLISVTLALNSGGSAPDEYKRSHPEFHGDTLLDVAFAELNPAGSRRDDDETGRLIDAFITDLFTIKQGESKNAVAKFADVLHALAKDTDDAAYLEVVRNDLVKIIQASQNLFNSEDFGRLLPGLDSILALNDSSDPQRNTLARFVSRFLHAFAPVSDGQTIKGLLLAIKSIDRSAIEPHGITDGIISMAQCNMYAQRRETADVKTSQLRAFLFLVENADRYAFLTVNGKETGIDLGTLLDSMDHPPDEPGTVKGEATHFLEWYMGEMATAARWGREGKIMLNGLPVFMNPCQAYDWMFYKKRYKVVGVGRKPLIFNGICEIVTNEIAQSFLAPGGKDTLATLAELAGGMTDAEFANGKYNGFTDSSWHDRYGTAGKRHKVLALVYPILEYIWSLRKQENGQRLRDFNALARCLNEIPTEGYQPLFVHGAPNRKATLRHDEQFAGKSVIKAVEDSNLLQIMSSSHGPNDNGMLAPWLDLLIVVVGRLNAKDSAPVEYKRNHPEFEGNTMLDYLFEEMRIKGLKRSPGDAADPVDKTIKALFVPPKGESLNSVAKLHGLVNVLEQFHAMIRGNSGHPSGSIQEERSAAVYGG